MDVRQKFSFFFLVFQKAIQASLSTQRLFAKPRRVVGGVSTVFLIFAICFFPLGLFESHVWAVFVNGEQVAVVKEQKMFTEALSLVVKKAEEEGFQKVTCIDHLALEKVEEKESLLNTPEELGQILGKRLSLKAEGQAITVEGKPEVVVKDEATAQALISAIKAKYLPKGENITVQEVKLREEVGFRPVMVGIAEIVPLGEAKEALLGKEKPFLHVVVTYEEKTKKPIPYPIEIRSERSLAWGTDKVLQRGEEGEKEVCFQVVTQNGKETARRVTATNVRREPVKQVVARGANFALAARGGGFLPWPCRGTVTSRYGYRGREFHPAIDIAAPKGTPVYAVAPGVVTSAGWEGGYGNCVTVDHGGGLVTRYAHLTRITKKAGEVIAEEEVLGTVGATGRATGNHLHFEVILNGEQHNPLRYLR